MNEYKYKVFINNEVIAERMDIEIATALIKALFEKYYDEHTMTISIKKEERVEYERMQTDR